MRNTNKQSTRYWSDLMEKSICKALGGEQQSNSGAGYFHKGDVVVDDMLIEAKTSMSSKASVSIKKEWLDKNKDEARSIRKSNSALAFRFEPEGENYYIIDEKLMKFLVEKLREDE